jgi:hypothetical protein
MHSARNFIRKRFSTGVSALVLNTSPFVHGSCKQRQRAPFGYTAPLWLDNAAPYCTCLHQRIAFAHVDGLHRPELQVTADAGLHQRLDHLAARQQQLGSQIKVKAVATETVVMEFVARIGECCRMRGEGVQLVAIGDRRVLRETGRVRYVC